MSSHIITFVTGLMLGALFLADSKLMSLTWINKATGLSHLSLNSQALVFAAIAISLGLTFRAIARKKGAQKTR